MGKKTKWRGWRGVIVGYLYKHSRLLPYRLRFWILRSRRGVGSVNRYVENHGHYKMEFGEEIMSGAGNSIPTLDCVSTT